ncbi:hypothetical protein TcasGA2_TC012399 [Tribolium castaneum]|uniref:Uncharacterized protein n=1 Tax=Tribolium castaneum TaxID=7070 RepID=D6X232_TRICA|nr:hypothetical protein TcasGA2_TC012399 [Tribolium castaneum]
MGFTAARGCAAVPGAAPGASDENKDQDLSLKTTIKDKFRGESDLTHYANAHNVHAKEIQQEVEISIANHFSPTTKYERRCCRDMKAQLLVK